MNSGGKNRVYARSPRGVSLLELIGVIAILGAVVLVVLPRLNSSSRPAKAAACQVTQGQIEVQVQQWRREKGVWPTANLSDIGASVTYFPSGLPVCPVDGSAYSIHATNHEVIGHVH